MTLKEKILATRASLKTAEVDTQDEIGFNLVIQELTAAEAEAIADSEKGNDKNALARWVAQSVIDPETKERVFSSADIGDIAAMGAALVMKVGTAAVRLNGFGFGKKENP